MLNLLHLADTLGHVPNGNRIYYINRRYDDEKLCNEAHCVRAQSATALE